MKKLLVVGVIVLFLGLAIAPSINANISISENDYVEVTTEVYGVKGFGKHIMKLTQQDYQDLQQYLATFKTDFQKTTTMEEGFNIFNDAMVELNKYDLLPEGLTVEQAQNLVTSFPQYKSELDYFDRFISKSISPEEYDEIVDILCLVAGESTNTVFQNIPNSIILHLGTLFFYTPLFILMYVIFIALKLGMYGPIISKLADFVTNSIDLLYLFS